MAIKAKVKLADGTEVEGDLASPPSGFLSEEQLQSELGRRERSVRRAARDELLDDPDFKAAFMAKHGLKVPVAGDPSGRPDPEVLKALERDLEETKVKPVVARAEKAEERVKKLARRTIVGDIVRAAREAGVNPILLKSVDGNEPPIVASIIGRVEIDLETDEPVAMSGDRPRMSTKGIEGRPYMGMSELFETMRANDQYSDLFVAENQGGAGVGRGASGAGNRPGVVFADDKIGIARNAEAIAKGTKVVVAR
jgi:hypothetical protein